MSSAPGLPHRFAVSVRWGGPGASATTEVRRFSRAATAWTVDERASVPPVEVSAARVFFGDRDAWNPETLLLSALAQCHLLAFLRAAGLEGHEVLDAAVQVSGELTVGADGAGRFVAATLTPRSALASPVAATELARLHSLAHRQCFIANSLAFPVTVAADAGFIGENENHELG